MGDFDGAADASQEVGKSMALGMGYVTWSPGPKAPVGACTANYKVHSCIS